MAKTTDRAKMTIASVGTSPAVGKGVITLGAASAGYNAFATSGLADRETFSYVLDDLGAGHWEYGTGVYTASGTTFARTPIYSDAGAATLTVITTNGVAYISALAEDIGPDFISINRQTALYSYSMPSGINGLSVGPVTVAAGFTVTIPTGSRWVVI